MLAATRRAHEAGAIPIIARRVAVSEVARARGVREATIRAACARGLRPQVRSLEEFDVLVASWLRGDGQGLAQVVLARVPDSERPTVDRLFDLSQGV